MTKVLLEYIGYHLPAGTYEIPEEKAEALLKTGIWKQPDKYPDKTWTEAQIKNWIKTQNVPVKYDVSKDTKEHILSELKSMGYG